MRQRPKVIRDAGGRARNVALSTAPAPMVDQNRTIHNLTLSTPPIESSQLRDLLVDASRHQIGHSFGLSRQVGLEPEAMFPGRLVATDSLMLPSMRVASPQRYRSDTP